MLESYFQGHVKRLDAYQRLFCDTDGEITAVAASVLSDLMHKTGAIQCHKGGIASSFVSGDPYSTAFNEGKRYMANYILYQLHLDYYDIYQLLKEYQS